MTVRQRLLIVGRDYMFYTRDIVAELRSGFAVDVCFVPIEPPSFAYRMLKPFPGLRRRWRERYHRRALAGMAGQAFDVVLFIQVHQIGRQIRDYRQTFGSARFVLYYWDSLQTHDYRPFLKCFDSAYSFDKGDAQQHPGIGYLPLFFAERFRKLRGQAIYRHDLVFVGTAVSLLRYEELMRMRELARRAAVAFFDYVVVSPIFYARMLLRGRLLRGVHFRAMGADALVQCYRDARAVLDLPNNVQSGYTMRTFEALGAHRKLVTTRRSAVAEDFYTTQSVFVLGVHGQFPDAGFFAAAGDFAAAIERYSLRSWIATLLPMLRPNAPGVG